VCVLDAVRAAGWLARIPEAEAALPAADTHPRTYSLTASGPNGELFLVTDDESGINIGHAKQIGGPLTARAALPAPALDPERLARALQAEGFVHQMIGRYGKPNDIYWENSAAALLAAYAALSPEGEG
jgi:hypothetical protein